MMANYYRHYPYIIEDNYKRSKKAGEWQFTDAGVDGIGERSSI